MRFWFHVGSGFCFRAFVVILFYRKERRGDRFLTGIALTYFCFVQTDVLFTQLPVASFDLPKLLTVSVVIVVVLL